MSNAFDKPPKRVTRDSWSVCPKICGFANLGSYLRRVLLHPLRRLPKSVYDLARVWLGLALRRRLHLKRRIEHFSPRLVIGHIAAVEILQSVRSHMRRRHSCGPSPRLVVFEPLHVAVNNCCAVDLEVSHPQFLENVVAEDERAKNWVPSAFRRDEFLSVHRRRVGSTGKRLVDFERGLRNTLLALNDPAVQGWPPAQSKLWVVCLERRLKLVGRGHGYASTVAVSFLPGTGSLAGSNVSPPST